LVPERSTLFQHLCKCANACAVARACVCVRVRV
jgi:hypothetical protein